MPDLTVIEGESDTKRWDREASQQHLEAFVIALLRTLAGGAGSHQVCFYYASELVVQGATIKLAEPADAFSDPYDVRVDRSFSRLCSLINSISAQILTLFHGCITAIVAERLANSKLEDPTELPNAPRLPEVHIPFFTDEEPAE
jgi:hypothetical protein